MVIRKKDMRLEVRSKMKNGTGDVSVLHLVEPGKVPNIRFVGEMTLPQGASIGNHVHDKETEYYIITEGIGVVTEDGNVEHKVVNGDVIVTGGGASHSIRNAGSTSLKIIAFIVTH